MNLNYKLPVLYLTAPVLYLTALVYFILQSTYP